MIWPDIALIVTSLSWYHLELIDIYLARCHFSRTHVTISSPMMHCAIDCHRITPQHKSSETQVRYHIEAEKNMADIFQTIFSDAFLWTKCFEYWHIYASLGLNDLNENRLLWALFVAWEIKKCLYCHSFVVNLVLFCVSLLIINTKILIARSHKSFATPTHMIFFLCYLYEVFY